MPSVPSSTSTAPALFARGLRYRVAGRTILDDVSLDVAPGTSVAVTGPSGCGKSTLLNCLAGITLPIDGKVVIAGHDVTAASASGRAALRLAHVGMVYQFGELLPELTALENVALPALMSPTPPGDVYARAEALLGELGLSGLRGSPTGTLSGGERQRLAVARALIGSPSLVLADEPTGSLDGKASAAVAELLFALPTQRPCALVVVTHAPSVAERADVVLTLAGGKLEGVR
ncbi:ABC transporter ATP-binding protein [Streptomyces sp. Isolate_45]|nr:ABC transporter ATP-binding protein [Streptomyces sp. Isolate_45]MDA5281157.1 ABC transporter ATP-binding protein [Streptomyces sp. Isolate_45]